MCPTSIDLFYASEDSREVIKLGKLVGCSGEPLELYDLIEEREFAQGRGLSQLGTLDDISGDPLLLGDNIRQFRDELVQTEGLAPRVLRRLPQVETALEASVD